jgi:hypothetical protein
LPLDSVSTAAIPSHCHTQLRYTCNITCILALTPFACAHSFDFAFKLDQYKGTTVRKYVAMIYVAVLQSAMMCGYTFGYVRQFVIKIQKPATSVVTVVSSLSCMGCCTPRDLPLVCNYANQAKGAPPFKIGCHGLEHLSILHHSSCDIFKFFQVFSTCLLTFPCFICMCPHSDSCFERAKTSLPNLWLHCTTRI